MNNKELQEKRMRGYFIQATKGILKGEGLRNVSVRNIAREAGYSYTTLYNYFKDANDLVFECVIEFQEEIIAFTKKQTKKTQDEQLALHNKLIAYANYFVNYPGIFELFYIEGIGDLGHRQKTLKAIENSIIEIAEEEWMALATSRSWDENKMIQMKFRIRNSMIGALLFYLNRRIPADYATFMADLKTTLDSILAE